MGHISLTSLLLLVTALYTAKGCEVQGISNWWLDLSVLDTDRGLLFQGDTTGIQSLISAQHSGEGLNSGPYFEATFENSQFTLSLSENFVQYEELETLSSMSISTTFGCTNGNSLNIVFIVSIIDTNNNAPVFIPSNEISFTVTPPLPPGYQVTGCFSAINVRDIDLTTQRIEFNIEPNDYFEIEYDAASSTEAKLFGAVLRTTSFVRSLSEPVTLWISATDVDLTGDPPLTTNATIRIEADGDFEFPDQPIFSQVFYRANYTDEHRLLLEHPINLNEGYDNLVEFSMTGEYADYFTLIPDGNQLDVEVARQLPTDLFQNGQILLELKAEREYTSGATATLIISLPEVPKLEFAQLNYKGTITDGILDLGEMRLASGYENGYEISITGDHSAYFTATTQDETITITLNNILEAILEENNFLTLEVTASNDYSSASTTVLLDIIKNDTITPLFEENAYIGSYERENGLELEPIVLVQGFDNTVTFNIEGVHSNLFTLIQNGNTINLQVPASIPDAILEIESHILLNVVARKSRTVGANTAVSISLPDARILGFEQDIYTGQVNQTTLTLETMLLSTEYRNDNVSFSLLGDFSSYFELTYNQGGVTLSMTSALPNEVILENSFLTLTVEASSFNAVPATANIVLEIIKQDIVTPVFNKLIYYGNYEGDAIDIENISLSQGYGNDVDFQLVGEYSSFFRISEYENQVMLTLLEDIPNELIFNEKVLSFNIVAEKPLTVGANAAISINFPRELTDTAILKFAQNNYVGTFEDNTLSLPNIVLEQGYTSDTTFLLTGDQAEYFTLSNVDNVISVLLNDELPTQATEDQNFIILEIAAERERAVSTSTTVIIGNKVESAIYPIFEQVYYFGVYTVANMLTFNETIRLAQGFDETVAFTLQGDNSELFRLNQDNNSVNLELIGSIPEQLIYEKRQILFTIVANKPDTVNAESVILIDLPDEPPIAILGFSEISYVGSIENGALQVEPITLIGGYYDNLNFTIYGDYSTYFSVSQNGNTIALILSNEFPIEALTDLAFIVVDIEVSRPDSISGFTSTILEITNEVPLVPVFDRTYYAGSYSGNNGLTFDYTMLLLQGYDDSVDFSLEGEDSQWFVLSHSGNNLTLHVSNEGTPQFEGRRHLLFSVVAEKPTTLPGSAAIIITLEDDDAPTIIRFDQTYYLGQLQNGSVTLDEIIISEGYTDETSITLRGDLQNYFEIINNQGIITIALVSELELLETNLIILEIQASSSNSISGFATIILQNDLGLPSSISFADLYYTGSYTDSDTFVFDKEITIESGYDKDVTFSLEGGNAQWFSLIQNENELTIVLATLIPGEVISNNHNLIFSVTASRNGTVAARVPIIISLLERDMPPTVLRFEQINYTGTISNQQLVLTNATLIEGYSENVTFILSGEYSSHFLLNQDGPKISLEIQNSLHDNLFDTKLIVMELSASGPNMITAYATIVLEILQEETQLPVFSSTYYIGEYSLDSELVFDSNITLIEGYDETVLFELEGDQSQWFSLTQSGNVVSISANDLPEEILSSNSHLVFVVSAQKPGSSIVKATVIITLVPRESIVLLFERNNYIGQINNGTSNIEPINLIQGYNENVVFSLSGDLASYFTINSFESLVTIMLNESIPQNSLPNNNLVILDVEASAPQSQSKYATVIFTVVPDNNITAELYLEFSQAYYTGSYSLEDGLNFEHSITLSEGYDDDVIFALEGENTEWFELTEDGNNINITINQPLPTDVLANNQKIIFTLTAEKHRSNIARTAIIISLTNFTSDLTSLKFEQNSYIGYLENSTLNLETILLSEGYNEDVEFSLIGDLANYFTFISEGPNVNLQLQTEIEESSLPENNIIVMELQASNSRGITAYSIIIVEVTQNKEDSTALIFSETYYVGEYTQEEGLLFDHIIYLADGYDETVIFELEGDNSEWFTLQQSGNSNNLTLGTPIPTSVLSNNNQLTFKIKAQKSETIFTTSTIVIGLLDDFSSATVLRFSAINYVGQIMNNEVALGPITLVEGYSENVTFTLQGELSSYFEIQSTGHIVSLSLTNPVPDISLEGTSLIILDLIASAQQAISALATIVLENNNVNNTNVVHPVFSETYYTGNIDTDGILNIDSEILLSEGYDETVVFGLEGDDSRWFITEVNGNSIKLLLTQPIPTAQLPYNHLVFSVIATKPEANTASAGIFIIISDGSSSSSGVSFERALYSGILAQESLQHEIITITGFNGTDINVFGEYSELFEATVSSGNVIVRTAVSAALPESTSYVALELRADAARTALIIDVIHSEVPTVPPVITFSAPSYDIRTDVSQMGLIGRVQATADNGERILYNIDTNNEHLLERLSVSEEGDLHLFAPANSGFYSFAVVASTAVTQVSASVTVRLTVEVISVCGENGTIGVPPLIVLDRAEEEPHEGLLVINGTDFIGCQYILSNRYPPEQNWLYVDERGLHALSIDREHESIAFMALSQIQVELTLQCDNDDTSATRSKRSVNEQRPDWLGPYDYGNSNWILSDSISYDPRRTFVNLIVNDINDNYPIFNDKENEPIAVGYPSQDIIDVITPKTLVELQATDADIGFNAALTYSSPNPEITVSPSTGSVHIRDNVRDLQEGAIFTIEATDQLGEGLTGNIQIMLRLLNVNQIAVVTVRNAFLDNEQTILRNLTDAIGYEVKSLSSAVISDEYDNTEELTATRKKRQTTETGGASLKLYVYGLIEKTPVEVGQLTSDINTNLIASVVVADSISLQDYLESLEICVIADSGRDTGLLIATIVLSILLFILIVLIALWFFLKWRKERNYDQFSDENSVASRNEQVNVVDPKPEITTRPRLNIEELKRSERRLQELLDAPVNEVIVEPTSSKTTLTTPPVPLAPPITLISNSDNNAPIVIQSIDKLKTGADESDGDEYGEIKSKAKRKSVVTFNENVEKIIHVEDRPEDVDSIQDVEIERL